MSTLKPQWTKIHINKCSKLIQQAMLKDEHSLALFSEDFGHIKKSQEAVVCQAKTIGTVQLILQYAQTHHLPVTLQCQGSSQSGQSLSIPGGLLLCLKQIGSTPLLNEHSIDVGASNTWSELLDISLLKNKIPYVIPYNCNLSIAGVLSAGGIGAASFKYGSASHNIVSLNLIQSDGMSITTKARSDLAQACLGGQGLFGIINKAEIKLRSCKPLVKTFFITYLNQDDWIRDLNICQKTVDHIEAFCSPAMIGSKLKDTIRKPFAQWVYVIQASIEYTENEEPSFETLGLIPWQLSHTQKEPIKSFLKRHDSRFKSMQESGQWKMAHPWYECFITEKMLPELTSILQTIPLHFATAVHLIPINPKPHSGFLMYPEENRVYSLMILNPGLPHNLVPSCIDTIHYLDGIFLKQGAKRYLSGYLGEHIDDSYWKIHFGTRYAQWLDCKKRFDPQHIFCSSLFEK